MEEGAAPRRRVASACPPAKDTREKTCSKRAARPGKSRPSTSISVHPKRCSEQGNHKKQQVDRLRPNELIIRWSLVRVQPAPQRGSM
jgi:hypothetical protein